MNKRKISLVHLVFMALCCDMGIFTKKLIAPAANILTEALHIPGGIGTSFSLMFVVVGAAVCNVPGGATLMSITQSFIALAIGTTGSLGILAPVGYVIPGIIVDVFFALTKRMPEAERIVCGNALAGMSAALCANVLTFQLKGPPLWLYAAVAFSSGMLSGSLGAYVVDRIKPVLNKRI